MCKLVTHDLPEFQHWLVSLYRTARKIEATLDGHYIKIFFFDDIPTCMGIKF